MARLPNSSSLPYGPKTLVSRILARTPSGWTGAGSLTVRDVSPLVLIRLPWRQASRGHVSIEARPRQQAAQEPRKEDGGKGRKQRQLLEAVEHHAADIQAIQASPLQGMRRPAPKTPERRPGPGERLRAGIPPPQPQPQARRDGDSNARERLRNRVPQRLSGFPVGVLEFRGSHPTPSPDARGEALQLLNHPLLPQAPRPRLQPHIFHLERQPRPQHEVAMEIAQQTR